MGRLGRFGVWLLCGALLAHGAPEAQSPPPSPASTPSAAPTSAGVQRVEVRLAQFDVVVRDRAGRTVSGLGRDDFRVVEDGVPLEIVEVDEWGAPPPQRSATSQPPPPSAEPTPEPAPAPATTASSDPPSEPEKRSFVLVFDALGDSTALRMSQAKQAAQKFVRAHLRSNDLLSVYQLDLSLRPLGGFTSNPEEASRSIERVAWRPGSHMQDEIAESVLAYSATGGNAYAQQRLTEMSMLAASQLDWQRDHTYESLRGLSEVFQGLPGRRVLVLVSPGFPMSTAGDLRAQTGGFTPKFQNLIRTLSRYGVTVYSMDIGNDLAIADAASAMDWRVAAGKFGMDENILEDLGLERTLGTGSAGKRREFLGFLAAETGGRLLTSSDLSRDFETIQEDSTHFYRVSCKVGVARDAARYRRTRIEILRPGLLVASRRGRYSDVTPLESRPRTGQTAESLDNYRSIAARGVAVPLPSADPRRIRVAVVVEALGPIELPTQGSGDVELEFRLVARAADEIVARDSFRAKVKADGSSALRNAVRAEGRLALVPGVYELQGTVRVLDPPQLANWTASVAVPPPSSSGLSLPQAFVYAERTMSPLISRPESSGTPDPLVLREGVRVLPSTTPRFDTGSSLLAAFWLRGIPVVEGKPKATIALEVLDDQGRVVEVATQLLYFAAEPSGGHAALARVDARSLPAGAFSLRVTARHSDAADASASRSIPFALERPAPVSTASSGR